MPKRIEPGEILSDDQLERLHMENLIKGSVCHHCGGTGLERAVQPIKINSPTGQYSCYYAGVCSECDGTGLPVPVAHKWLIASSVACTVFWIIIYLLMK